MAPGGNANIRPAPAPVSLWRISDGVAPTMQFTLGQVVPPAIHAHLYDIPVELVVLGPQLVEFSRIRKAAAIGRLERISIYIGHQIELVAATYRT